MEGDCNSITQLDDVPLSLLDISWITRFLSFSQRGELGTICAPIVWAHYDKRKAQSHQKKLVIFLWFFQPNLFSYFYKGFNSNQHCFSPELQLRKKTPKGSTLSFRRQRRTLSEIRSPSPSLSLSQSLVAPVIYVYNCELLVFVDYAMTWLIPKNPVHSIFVAF